MASHEPLVVLRDLPTATNPWRRIPHRVDQQLWLTLFGRHRTATRLSTPGQRPYDRSKQ